MKENRPTTLPEIGRLILIKEKNIWYKYQAMVTRHIQDTSFVIYSKIRVDHGLPPIYSFKPENVTWSYVNK